MRTNLDHMNVAECWNRWELMKASNKPSGLKNVEVPLAGL
jgi:hypothetical protein